MLPKIDHHPVNWVDGMKISRKHFSDFEHFVSDHLRDVSAVNLTTYNYGLLASDAPDFSLRVITDQNQNIRVQLTNCRAITGAGCRIDIIGGQLELSTSLPALMEKYNIAMADELQFLVVLSVDLFARQPEGLPANNEPFPRPPFTLPTYQLTVVPGFQYEANGSTGRSNGLVNQAAYASASFESYHLIVGQLNCSYGQLSNDESFIPACTAVSAHVGLATWVDQSAKLFAELQRDSYRIVTKVIRKRRTQEAFKAGPLAELIRVLAEQVAHSLDDVLNHLQYGGGEQPPQAYLKVIGRATRNLRTTLDCLAEEDKNAPALGRELVLPYFQSWTNIEPARLEAAINDLIAYPYQHTRVADHLKAVNRCWDLMQQIFRKMTELEYIGQENTDYDFDTQRKSTHKSDIHSERVNDPFSGGYSFQ